MKATDAFRHLPGCSPRNPDARSRCARNPLRARLPLREAAPRQQQWAGIHICSGAQSKCGGRAIKGAFRRTIGENIGDHERTLFETERIIDETDARSRKTDAHYLRLGATRFVSSGLVVDEGVLSPEAPRAQEGDKRGSPSVPAITSGSEVLGSKC